MELRWLLFGKGTIFRSLRSKAQYNKMVKWANMAYVYWHGLRNNNYGLINDDEFLGPCVGGVIVHGCLWVVWRHPVCLRTRSEIRIK